MDQPIVLPDLERRAFPFCHGVGDDGPIIRRFQVIRGKHFARQITVVDAVCCHAYAPFDG